MGDTKVLYGVCGIGMGHTLRQTPIIDRLALTSRMLVFAFGESYRYYADRFRGSPNVTVAQVSVPFYTGGPNGIDFTETALRASNFTEDALTINCSALAKAQALLGKPDLVVTDYEPVCAQYAYGRGAPLVTIDQQSKYLVGSFPSMLHGEGFADEVQRLRMFFPRAQARFACSFFRVPRNAEALEKVQLVAPILSREVLAMSRRRTTSKEVLVYLSSQRPFGQSLEELVHILASQPGWRFHVFVPRTTVLQPDTTNDAPNIRLYAAGDGAFHGVLQRAAGIITTAGHTLLSEAMHLRKPVYALPLAVYEQQMNAHIIDVSGFGIARPQLTVPQLAEFLGGLDHFAANIRNDRKVLLRGSGEDRIARYLQRRFLS